MCPVEHAGALDAGIRKLVQDPAKILRPWVWEGMTVLDLGCGPGFFSIEIAKMVGKTGKVFAADLQEGMLEKLGRKIANTPLVQRIQLHKCRADGVGLSAALDFVLLFYVLHEVPDKPALFRELRGIMKPGAALLVVEPKFHVGKKDFMKATGLLVDAGFTTGTGPRVFFSRSVLARRD
ncbi:MAG: class I SAM-dependent methyltransferase [Spirochaetes bacterium]|nr:MAG: class I SAM-dependent methyltransferase [Spirochaetota bacterium]